MDAFRIAETEQECAVTESMVAEQTLRGAPADMLSGNLGSTTTDFDPMLLGADIGDRGPTTADKSNYSMTGRSFHNAMTVGSLVGDFVRDGTNSESAFVVGGGDDDDDEITSDDSGDFGALTHGISDAEDYDLVRALIAFDKQQEREIAALLRECEDLEKEQNRLWRNAVTAEQAKQRNERQHRRRVYGQVGGDETSNAEEEEEEGRYGCLSSWRAAHEEVIDEDLDEFEDVWVNTGRSCRYLDPANSFYRRRRYRYAEPDHPGEFKSVFDQGLLFRSVTDEGAWVFYNDSEKYMMHVKYWFGGTSTIAAGPNATVKRLPSGEIEVQVMVAPEETQVLLLGEVNGFRNMSLAVPVEEGFANPHVERHNAGIGKALHALATKARTNVKLLSPEDALTCCRQEGIPFIDPDFVPCSASIYRADVDTTFLWSEPWRRPADYMAPTDAAEVRLFRGQVLPCDPCPGDSGDVYFCSAAAILAEFPMLVRALFQYPLQAIATAHNLRNAPRDELRQLAAKEAKAERNAHGFRVTVNHGGWWHHTVLDDYLPASLVGPAFGRCEDDLRKLWYPLLQKAYAKCHGSYAAIQCGDVAEALQDLSGFPASRFDDAWAEAAGPSATQKDKAELFEYLREQRKRGYVVCLSLPDEGPESGRAPAMGLHYGMSYYVMDMVELLSFDAATTYRLVQLRCPTVKPDWDGLWCPDSIRWREGDPELLKLCGGEGTMPRDGVWLDWSKEVLALFEGGAVWHTHFGMHDYRVRGEFNDGIPSLALEVSVCGSQPVEMVCTLSQQDDRGSDPNCPTSALSPLMLCVSEPAPLPHGGGVGGSSTTSAYQRRASRSVTSQVSGGVSARGPHEAVADPASVRDEPIRKQVITCVCSTNPDYPTEKLNFIVGRDVSLRYTFRPRSEEDQLACSTEGNEAGQPYVYYIIPRARGAMHGKSFSITLLSSSVIGGDEVRVRFVKPCDKCEVFRNRREFGPDRMSDPVRSANYQIRDHDGVITSLWGPAIVTEP